MGLGSPSLREGSGPNPRSAVLAGRYRLRYPIGTGGMSTVFLAEDLQSGRPVAIKCLTESAMAKPGLVRRFIREARGTASLDHPHIVEICDVGQTDAEVAFFVMEYLDGEHLGDTLAREGPMAWERVVKLVRPIASALALAHEQGIVHRDLKPENCVRITREGEPDIVKLIDFGVAKFEDGERTTKAGCLVGTPQYLAPEAIAGESADLRVDVYALGVLMFELLTGEVPFDDPQLMEVLTAHRYDPVPRLGARRPGIELPSGAEALVHKALAKRVEDRFANMGELLAALDEVAAGAARNTIETPSGPARPALRGPMEFARPSREAEQKAARRRRWWHGLVAVAGVISFAASLGYAALHVLP